MISTLYTAVAYIYFVFLCDIYIGYIKKCQYISISDSNTSTSVPFSNAACHISKFHTLLQTVKYHALVLIY